MKSKSVYVCPVCDTDWETEERYDNHMNGIVCEDCPVEVTDKLQELVDNDVCKSGDEMVTILKQSLPK